MARSSSSWPLVGASALLLLAAPCTNCKPCWQASGLPYHLVDADPSRPGMGDSIAAGVKATPSATAWLILPADLPLIQSSTLRTIAFAPPCAVTVPMFQGQRGHPVRFGLECASELLNLQGNQGAAQVIKGRVATDSVARINLDDMGCVLDVDTVEDLKRAEDLLLGRPG
jgi:molybdenum cofactor cytidylyltransferase